MITSKRLPKSIRKFLRREKARIRQEFFDTVRQEEEIKKLYQKFGQVKYNRENKETKTKVGAKNLPRPST